MCCTHHQKNAFKDSEHMEMIFLALWGPNCRTKPTHAHLVFHGPLTGQWEADNVSKGQKASFKPPVLLVSGAVLVLSRLLVFPREKLKLHTQTLQGFSLCHIRAAVMISTSGVRRCLVAFLLSNLNYIKGSRG